MLESANKHPWRRHHECKPSSEAKERQQVFLVRLPGMQ
jgi:hypothetical protein